MESLKLLVVEDDLPSLELMTEVFQALKADVRPIADSLKAATMINQEKFDGIFLDLEMPRISGFELAQKVRHSSWNKNTPIVIVSGREERDTMGQAFATGATFFLQKPVDRQKLGALYRTVRGALDENRRRSLRVPMQTEVTCTVGARSVKGITWNLSQGGMQVEVNDLRPEESVRVSFRLPTSTTMIDVFGVVVWVKPDRQGIKFTKITNQNQVEVRNFIAQVGRN
ncbi:MAG TPA: response regulator [Terriglobales bacterium]|nr:response regulator [Terriglobales bacterium]